MLTKVEIVRPRVPTVLAAPCAKPWRKGPGPAGGAETVEDLYARGDVNEQRLLACGDKVAGVIEWDKP
ncbi:hypothetical protein [Mesorhizobium sp. B1-1-7]|uniref:hypothetical protein n=1 Tax=Mesorhizobium sp. B1-1-7 TaxID=2589977 RepID=UPI0015E39AA0|nr:hypothetical protein [Mesorhizobium sp. B1-1-7]